MSNLTLITPPPINVDQRVLGNYTLPRDYSGRIRRFTSPPDTDFCIYRRVVRVGTMRGDVLLEFWRSTCIEFTPRPPSSSSDGISQAPFDANRVVNKYIMPPLDYNTAVQAGVVDGQPSTLPTVMVGRGLTGVSFVTHNVGREESVVDTDIHPDGFFCAAFLKPSGVYEVALLFSLVEGQVVEKLSLIFAPSAWRHAAQVLANLGSVSGNKTGFFVVSMTGTLRVGC